MYFILAIVMAMMMKADQILLRTIYVKLIFRKDNKFNVKKMKLLFFEPLRFVFKKLSLIKENQIDFNEVDCLKRSST